MKSTNWRALIFLTSSFISGMGDTILVTALPQGFGYETGKIQFSVIAWMVPAIAVFAASFLAKKVTKRHDSARTDYATILFGIAALEIVVAIMALFFTDQTSALILIIAFLVGYAFIKEGLPRLLYQITMYRFFAEDHEYNKLVGLKGALDVVAMLAGMLIAARLVSQGTWRIALILDATTFVIFGAVLWFVGRDYKAVKQTAEERSHRIKNLDRTSLLWVLMTLPFLHALNALFPNYFPMISQKMGFFDIGTSIIAIALLRMPGVISGIFFGRIQEKIPPRVWVRLLPVIYTVAGYLFLISPATGTMGLMVFFSGLNTGIFSSSDVLVRNQLSGQDLIHFNKLVLRWLAIFQFTACCISIWMYGRYEFNRPMIAILLVIYAVCAYGVSRFHEKTIVLQEHK